MDQVFIVDLKADAVIGVYDWERKIRQTLSLDLEMDWDCAKAGGSDQLADALDYAAVADRISGFINDSSFQLIEALAEGCAQILLEEFCVSRVMITLRKPAAVKNAASVGVRIERFATNS